MEGGSWHPTILQKIHGQPEALFTRKFPSSLPRTPCAYVKAGSLQSHLLPTSQGNASPLVTPLPPFLLGAPLEKRNAAPAVNLPSKLGVEVAMRTVTAPIVRVRLLMQSQNEMINLGRLGKPYRGSFDCFARTVSNEGTVSMWRGTTASLIECVFSKVLLHGSHNYFKKVFDYEKEKDSKRKRAAGILAASTLAAATTRFFVYPLHFAQTRLASDIYTASTVRSRQFNGLIDVYRKIIKSDGIGGIYRGYPISLIGGFVGHVVSIGVFIALNSKLGPPQSSSVPDVILRLALPLVCADLTAYPMDTVCRRMMMTSGEAIKYKSSLDAFSQILKNDGRQSLFMGAGPHILQMVVKWSLPIAAYWIWMNMSAKKDRYGGGDQPAFTIRWGKGEG